LRQYALLSSILRRALESPTETPVEEQKETRAEQSENMSMPAFLSNADPAAAKLDAILSDLSNRLVAQELGTGTAAETSTPAPPKSSSPRPDVKIDVSLRSPMSPYSPSIMLIFNAEQEISRRITMRIDVNRNGRVSVSEITGISFNEEALTDRENKEKELCTKLAKVVETSEDLSMLAEWTLRWMRRQREATLPGGRVA
jgi:hypothetical protein